MIDKKEFEAIKKDLENFEEKREGVIQKSRTIIHLSKQIINALHRNNIKEAEKFVEDINKEVKDFGSECYDTGIYRAALQEYAEAMAFYYYIKHEKLPTRKEIGVNTEEYLLGLCDLTGELMRKAVNEVIAKEYDSALKIKDLVSELYSEFLKLNFRNGELRKKFDSIKWNLQKLEDLALQVKLKK